MAALPGGIQFERLTENRNHTATVTFKLKANGISGEVNVTVLADPSADRCIEEAILGLTEFLRF